MIAVHTLRYRVARDSRTYPEISRSLWPYFRLWSRLGPCSKCKACYVSCCKPSAPTAPYFRPCNRCGPIPNNDEPEVKLVWAPKRRSRSGLSRAPKQRVFVDPSGQHDRLHLGVTGHRECFVDQKCFVDQNSQHDRLHLGVTGHRECFVDQTVNMTGYIVSPSFRVR